ncbi:MAG: small basic protein [Phycisphaerales bacterium]
MSLHRSLKTESGALQAHRNVLTRAERIAKLTKQGRFKVGDTDPIHLPKVASIKVTTGKKKKDADEDADAAVAAPVAAAAAKPAAKKAAGKAKK